jgi:1-acyl-sn-glycerol-3-phosphate acyltransferase
MSKSNSKIQYPSPLIIGVIRYSLLFLSKLLWRIEYHDTQNIPQKLASGLLVLPNHQTYFDPFWITLPIKRKYRFMAWDQAFNWFLIGRVIRYLGAFPVSLNRGGTRKAMVEALKSLRDGATLMIFPEGSRGFSDGKLLSFKPGAVRIAMEAKVPILPVTICGANKVWAQDIKFPHLKKVDIYFHPVFEIPAIPEGVDEHEFAEQITGQIREIIESKLEVSSEQ